MQNDTLQIHSGKDPLNHDGIVNMPVYRASTVLFPTLDAFNRRAWGDARYRGITYGACGTPTTFALADSVAALEGGQGAAVTASGLAAVTMAITAFVSQGDHILVTDSVYSPTRLFCDTQLRRFGVRTTYYDPLIGAGIADLIEPRTRVIFCESPGSLTFEVQDVPAIAAVARQKGIAVLLDNTWATPLFFKPFEHGVDISIQAGTKYIAGHSDLVIGIITARTEALFRKIKDTTLAFGDIAGPDDCYLALRGLRSLSARLRQHRASADIVTRWLLDRSEVKKVLYPAMPQDEGYHLWQRDFSGATSLFGVVLHETEESAVARMINDYRFFKIGASWGGFESLVLPAKPARIRTATPWREPGYVLRYHVGLEAPDDLIDDLAAGFARLAQST
jgi:cystathionine beta-lyase